ncbi:hypothetical protein Cgig2_001641 [Carnegiea gigantea]|uniref:MutL C-terminal dimerisation domain-containing protein n=1 Tax=Carnegiea gigantea TaxID=171969 RepID=A0A9Q1GZC4_9CARY|nr:hypothetical protein Cgig2_001641 [Carnegiea gigantea]
MERIRPLSEALHSAVRSGFIISDLTTVVEELVHNSLDAGATKVIVYVGVSNGYVKVEDDGYGISRDGLVLLGERYATSKFHHLQHKDDDAQSFGFRGEALCSIADTSLIEIITKVQGRPNGYRKVMKARTAHIFKFQYYAALNVFMAFEYFVIDHCNFFPRVASVFISVLMIVDKMLAQLLRYIPAAFSGDFWLIGFFNAYVCSAKKVLHSVKKCTIRIALVQPRVSFKVVDMDSEDELLRTHSSFSPLAVLCSNFGFEASSLHGLTFSQGDSYNGKTDQTGTAGKEKLVKNMITAEKDWLLKTCKIPTKRRKIQNTQNEQLSAKSSLKPMEMLFEDGSLCLCEGTNRRGRNLLRNTANFGEAETDGEFPYQMDFSESRGACPLNCIFDIGRSIDNCLLETDKELDSLNEGLSENFVTTVQRDYDEGDFLPRSRREVGPTVDAYARKSEAGNGWGCQFGLQNDQLQALSSEIPTPFKYNKASTFQIENPEANEGCGNFMSKADAYSLSHKFSIQRVQSQNGIARNWPFSRLCIESDMWEDRGITSTKCHDSFSFYSGSFDREHTLNYPSEQVGVFTPRLSPNTDQYLTTSYPFLNMKPWDLEHIIQDEGLERRYKVRNCDAFEQSNNDKEEFYHNALSNNCFYENSFPADLDPDLIFMNEYAGAKKGILECSNHEHSVNPLSTATDSDNFYEVPHSTCMDRRERNHRYSPSICCSPSKSINTEAQMDGRRYEALHADHKSGGKMRRGDHKCSPPDLFLASSGNVLNEEVFSPFLNFQSKYDAVTPSFPLVSSMSTKKGPKIDRRGCEAPERNCRLSRQMESSSRSKRSYSAPPICRAKRRFFSVVDYLISTAESLAVRVAPRACNATGGLKPVQDTETLLIKWREDFQDGRLADIVNSQDVGDGLAQLKDENTILDIDSCMLHVAGDSLVPKSIDRSCLENANVLLQVDKKFIPVVAGGTLAVIDQHAADERIRLEEMRKKALPEMAYQLLCNYAEHVQRWGWICNIFCQDSGSFNKDLNLLNGQPMHLSLLAVPCILGVDLSDADLLEFLEQLADTDGSSTIPPAILRILNYKACRGAIMFGDKLLPSECNLIVEELKHTSLCFQCAHGRPTTVPLVNLEALHKSIAQLGSWHEGSENLWHGLCRREINLERAKRRLDVAISHGCRCMHGLFASLLLHVL